MPIATPAQFQRTLLRWFDEHGRTDMPWQINKTPYRVWVSEIMLQQTQVNTATPYYLRFMKRFPTLKSLADATEDDVLHQWTGLGYYSRARNLHKAAKKIQAEFKGKFPDTLEGIVSLPGIGRSTAGAILSIAFKQQATILDGNVKRVLARYLGITDPINQTATEQRMWEAAIRYTPKNRADDYSQAMMDLGATLCTRAKPQCGVCPLKKSCEGLALGIAETLPRKTSTKAIPTKIATFLVIEHQGYVLLEKRPAKGIWGGLYALPQLEGEVTPAEIKAHCREKYQATLSTCRALPAFRHTFSHYHLECKPQHLTLPKKAALALDAPRQLWYKLDAPSTIGLPKPILSILRNLT